MHAMNKQGALETFKEYKAFISRVDRLCDRIYRHYGQHMACEKGCAGNCCRIHLSVFPVEAVSFAIGLQKLPRKTAARIRHNARQTGSFGPCPLLEDGACLLYDCRAVICRTHGFPVRTEYRGHRSVGFCLKNFQNLAVIPDDAVIDLARLNGSLTAVNRCFVSRMAHRFSPSERFTVAQALLMKVPDFYLVNNDPV